MSGTGLNHHYNIDGFAMSEGAMSGQQRGSYSQAFRTGELEAVSAAHALRGHPSPKLYPLPLEKDVANVVERFVQLLTACGYDGPCSVMVALVNVKGATLEHRLHVIRIPGQERSIDRDVVILPDLLIEQTDPDVRATLRPVFDALWQSGGYERSYGYEPDGTWRPLPDHRS